MAPAPSQPPVGTRHKVKPVKKLFSSKLAALEKELEQLPSLIKEKFKKWTNGAREFQLDCMRAQVLKQDVLLQAATGSGKTGIAAGPHLLPSSKGKVTLVVSPLLALEEEQAATFQEEFGLKAVAINSENGGCKQSVMAEIVAGDWQIVLLSPEMLVSRKFIDGVLRKPAFGSRCLSVFIDEAHCVSHWGASFRKAYGSIGIIRAFLPRQTPIVAVTATLTPMVERDLIQKLQFKQGDYLHLNLGNDRPNVSQVVRAMEHPANTFHDLDFLVPTTMSSPTDIKKCFLYSDDIKAGALITDYLNARVDPKYRKRGLIRPYNASMSKKYRRRVMKQFREGKIRVLVCTDAAGMGCDIPDVDIVVQWKSPENLSSWVQRAGRVARGPGYKGLAVMIVEKSAFEVVAFPQPGTTNTAGGKGLKSLGRQQGARSRPSVAKNGSEYAVAHGQKRGAFEGKHDTIIKLDEAHVTSDMLRDAKGEALFYYIQTTICRRAVLRRVFQNEPSDVDTALCCDLCNPGLFDQVRPSKPQPVTRQRAPKRHVVPVDSVRTALYSWRKEMKRKYWPRSLWGPQAILNDDFCELLSSVGPVESKVALSSILQGSWEWWDKLGDELYLLMCGLEIPALPVRGTKRRPVQEASNTQLQLVPTGPIGSSPTKRPRTTRPTQPDTAQASAGASKKRQLPTFEFPPSAYDSFFSNLSSHQHPSSSTTSEGT